MQLQYRRHIRLLSHDEMNDDSKKNTTFKNVFSFSFCKRKNKHTLTSVASTPSAQFRETNTRWQLILFAIQLYGTLEEVVKMADFT